MDPAVQLEQVMRAHLATLDSVDIRFSTEFVSADQDGDAVSLTLRDVQSDATSILRSGYVVGTDGARSLVRKAIGATMSGEYSLSRNYNIVSSRCRPGCSAWRSDRCCSPRSPTFTTAAS